MAAHGSTATLRNSYPQVTAATAARQQVKYTQDRPALLLQTKSRTQEDEDWLWEELAKKPELPPAPQLEPFVKTQAEIKRESLLHRSRVYRRQHDGNVFTIGGPTSNLCAFQVP